MTHEGIESAFAVNVVAPYLLTTLLLDMLKQSRPAQVINLAGGIPFGRIELDNLQSERQFSAFNAYSHTKRAMLAMSVAFARQLEGTGVTVNVAYPGRADTPMTQSMTIPLAFRVLSPVASRFMKMGEETVIRASRCSIYLASSPDVDHVTGAYYGPDAKPMKWPAITQDRQIQDQLWTLIGRLTTVNALSAPAAV